MRRDGKARGVLVAALRARRATSQARMQRPISAICISSTPHLEREGDLHVHGVTIALSAAHFRGDCQQCSTVLAAPDTGPPRDSIDCGIHRCSPPSVRHWWRQVLRHYHEVPATIARISKELRAECAAVRVCHLCVRVSNGLWYDHGSSTCVLNNCTMMRRPLETCVRLAT